MQDKKLLIFGNGLGMSIDPKHFQLDKSLNKTWINLSDEDKLTLSGCLPSNGDNQIKPPSSEEELDALHSISSACNFLNSFEKNASKGYLYLNDKGKSLPLTSRMFIYKVAADLFLADISIKNAVPDFERLLIEFIKTTNSHVATLNYDKILYSSFIDNGLCKGFDGNLVDGFTEQLGFSTKNLERKFGKNFGYYLHLHGSPLFLNCDDRIIKLSAGEVANASAEYAKSSINHVVLSNIEHKPEMIASSPLLRSYWETLIFCMSEVNQIILFGYSGCDIHLNRMLNQFFNKKIRIIEWDGENNKNEREQFWKKTLPNSEVLLEHLTSITSFKSWHD